MLIKHKENCLSIIGKQSVKLEKGKIGFGNYFKQVPVPFKISADYKWCWKLWKFLHKKCQGHVSCSFAYQVIYSDDRFTKSIVVFYRGENDAYEFIKAILKEYMYCKKVINKHLFISTNNSCWICKKLTDNDEEKVRDHCHVTGKYRGAAHWNCNKNLHLTKKVPVIFHNLRDCGSYLIFVRLINLM